MGNFRIEIEAVGGHGCQREIGDGGTVYGCGRMGCPDCETRRFIREMVAAGTFSMPIKAILTHWPGQPSQVVDDLLTQKRLGKFGI